MATGASVLSLTPADAPKLPTHVAVIMDGNGRWAKERGHPRLRGHTQGAEALRGLIKACSDHPHIRHLTLYAFSAENWKRPADEVNDLMNLLRHYIKREAKALHEAGIRMCFIGDLAALQPDIQKDLHTVETMTEHNEKLTVTMALSYGSRQEITHAARKLAQRAASGTMAPEAITEEMLGSMLYTANQPEPDLLIRTGGNHRLSNFLLWQSAYTELYFTDTLWPDFTAEHLKQAIDCYSQRERRFGARHA